MGGILSKFRTNKDKESGGVWVTYDEVINDDGTKPMFKVRRITVYERAYQAKITPILSRLDKLGKANDPDPAQFAEENKKLFKAYVEHFLVDWKNIKEDAEYDQNGQLICDDEGIPICKELPFSRDAAIELICNLDAIQLAQWLMKQSSDVNNFLISNRETELKN